MEVSLTNAIPGLARVVVMLREARASSVQRHRPLPTVSLSNVEAIGGSRRLHVGV